jgi:hypothetical protein
MIYCVDPLVALQRENYQLRRMTDPEPPDDQALPADAEPEREQLARAPRNSVFLSATVERFGGGAPTRHRVRDLSTGGVRLDQATMLQTGATVLVSVGALEAVAATIVWVKDGQAGIKFAEAIDPDAARARAAVAPRPAQQGAGSSAPGAPSVGWIPALKNPYGR